VLKTSIVYIVTGLGDSFFLFITGNGVFETVTVTLTG
jgi:hypothetical protein